MIIAMAAALAAAFCWALSSLISVYPSQHLGAIGFNRTRSLMIALVLGAIATVMGGWSTVADVNLMLTLLLGGIVGIFIGDTALFATLRRMGPRRTAILFAMNAPMVCVLGAVFLGEIFTPVALFGCAMVLAGVVLAIVYGKKKSQLHKWEEVKGPVAVGVSFGLIAAAGQAVGIIITKPVMDAGADPIAASCLRVGIAGLALSVMAFFPPKQFKLQAPLNRNVAGYVLLSAILGMGIGMTLLMYGLAHGDAGIVATLAATSPVMMLPLIWFKTKECPAAGAWIGALMVAAGTGLIFNA